MWGTRTLGGVERNFDHLDPFVMEVKPKAEGAPRWNVRVSFGHHTFTEGCKADDDPGSFVADGTDVRTFCPIRYAHSHHLPGIVLAAAAGKAYFSQQYNYLLVSDLDGLDHPYAVFFRIERAQNIQGADAAMFVISAYEKPGLPTINRLQAISMPTLVSKILYAQPLTRRKNKRRHKAKK